MHVPGAHEVECPSPLDILPAAAESQTTKACRVRNQRQSRSAQTAFAKIIQRRRPAKWTAQPEKRQLLFRSIPFAGELCFARLLSGCCPCLRLPPATPA